MLDCYAIVIENSIVPTNRMVSQRQYKFLLESAQRHNWKIKKYPAVDGPALTKSAWKSIQVELNEHSGKLTNRPGAQGCFFSHFRLWEICLSQDQPIIILEHDAVIQAPLPEIDLTQGIVKLFKSHSVRQNLITGVWSKGAYGYALSPGHAKLLVNGCRIHGAQALDKMIGSNIVPWKFLDQDLIILPNKMWSTTSPTRKII
jgi:hypothetical protein